MYLQAPSAKNNTGSYMNNMAMQKKHHPNKGANIKGAANPAIVQRKIIFTNTNNNEKTYAYEGGDQYKAMVFGALQNSLITFEPINVKTTKDAVEEKLLNTKVEIDIKGQLTEAIQEDFDEYEGSPSVEPNHILYGSLNSADVEGLEEKVNSFYVENGEDEGGSYYDINYNEANEIATWISEKLLADEMKLSEWIQLSKDLKLASVVVGGVIDAMVKKLNPVAHGAIGFQVPLPPYVALANDYKSGAEDLDYVDRYFIMASGEFGAEFKPRVNDGNKYGNSVLHTVYDISKVKQDPPNDAKFKYNLDKMPDRAKTKPFSFAIAADGKVKIDAADLKADENKSFKDLVGGINNSPAGYNLNGTGDVLAQP